MKGVFEFRKIFKLKDVDIRMNKIGINIVIEREKTDSKIIFVASSPDINVFAEGKSIDEVKEKFIKGVKNHFEAFPEDKISMTKENNSEFEMPMIQKIFL